MGNDLGVIMANIVDAIKEIGTSNSWELIGEPATEAEFNANFTNHDSSNPITWTEAKTKLDELNA